MRVFGEIVPALSLDKIIRKKSEGMNQQPKQCIFEESVYKIPVFSSNHHPHPPRPCLM
jgi:hypothetical protein